MNPNSTSNSSSIKNSGSKKIKRRNFFAYLGVGVVGALAITKLPFKMFQQKLKAEASVKVKVNPYAVKRDRDMSKRSTDAKGKMNG